MAWKIVIALLSVAYPVLVFCGLCFWHLSPRTLSLLLVAAGLFLFVSRTQRDPAQRKNRNSVVLLLAMLALVGIVWVTDNALALKFYPVLVSLTVFASFAYTLRFPPTMIFRFAAPGRQVRRERSFPRVRGTLLPAGHRRVVRFSCVQRVGGVLHCARLSGLGLVGVQRTCLVYPDGRAVHR